MCTCPCWLGQDRAASVPKTFNSIKGPYWGKTTVTDGCANREQFWDLFVSSCKVTCDYGARPTHRLADSISRYEPFHRHMHICFYVF